MKKHLSDTLLGRELIVHDIKQRFKNWEETPYYLRDPEKDPMRLRSGKKPHSTTKVGSITLSVKFKN